MRRGALAAALVAAVVLGQSASAGAALPQIKHVFIVVLENEDAQTTYGPGTKAPYLAQTLRARGAFVPGYFGTGHLSLDNYVSLVSGQGPNPYTQADAPAYVDFLPGIVTTGDGQAIGQGSVYPASVKTVADQLDSKGGTWRGYMEDMANSKTGQRKTCRHPAIGAPDDTQQAEAGDQYATRHNPFMYFHSIIDTQARCDKNVVDLTALPADLKSGAKTPNYSFITPNLCHDGHDSPCVDGQPGGLVSADAFLKQWIPKIVASPAYADGGLVMIIFDEAATHDASACCGEQQGPNTPNNGGPTPGAGGGRVGAVFLSKFIKPGTESKVEYNHYSLLRSVEDMFGLAHLGYAGAAGLKPFGSDIFNNPAGSPKPPIPPPTVSLSKPPQQCVTRRFQVTAKSTGARVTMTITLDGHLVRTTRAPSITVTISGSRAKPGRHTILATATDRFGRRASRSRQFVRCGTD